MTDLQINIALAKAMGWGKNVDLLRDKTFEGIRCWSDSYWRKFDYRDPVIFVAICKRWKLQIEFPYKCYKQGGRFIVAGSIEKAAALCVIDLVKKGEFK